MSENKRICGAKSFKNGKVFRLTHSFFPVYTP